MTAPLIVVTGTGTEIGKTHISAALLTAWVRAFAEAGLDRTVAGLKPVESGLNNGIAADGSMLEQLSTLHVKQFPAPYLLARPVSPHLAARDEGRSIDLSVISDYVSAVRAKAGAVLVELAGGLFSPLASKLTNCDVAKAVGADAVLLVAPDRLGVLHDIAAAHRAAESEGLTLSGVVLVSPATSDLSTGTNAGELHLVSALPVLAQVPRGNIDLLSRRADVSAIISRFV